MTRTERGLTQPKVPAQQQWEEAAQGPVHVDAYLEQTSHELETGE